jgi:hypothetical protein
MEDSPSISAAPGLTLTLPNTGNYKQNILIEPESKK